MSENITIKNNNTIAIFSTLGAELISLKKDGRELIWNGDPKFWASHAPVMFPICGGLKDDKFLFDGNEYTISKHGFARNSEFVVDRISENSVVFLLKSNEETKKMYPFEFEFRIKYILLCNTLKVIYITKNVGNGDMLYSIGAHEAYACDGGIENFSVIFDKEEVLDRAILNGNLISKETTRVLTNEKELKLSYDYFESDALVFDELKSRKVTLKNNKTNDEILVEFEDFKHLLIWTKPGAGYICIEPWNNIPDRVGSSFDFREKPDMIKLMPNEESVLVHTIKF